MPPMLEKVKMQAKNETICSLKFSAFSYEFALICLLILEKQLLLKATAKESRGVEKFYLHNTNS